MAIVFSRSKVKVLLGSLALVGMIGLGVALAIGNNLAFGQYSNTISHHLAPNGDKNSANAQAARNMGNQLAREIEREGIVMVHNNGTLPLAKSIKKVNVFGHGSVDWYIMSSGSEMVGTDGQTSYGIVEAFEHYGIEVNRSLQDYYLKWHRAEGDSNTIQSGLDSFYQIREPSLETDATYKTLFEDAKNYSRTAFFVVSRHAGENSDCPHYQNKVEGQPKDTSRTYLQISTEEEYCIRQLAQNFDNVIVVINSTNAMQLDFVKRIEGIDACISVGATGVQGALSIPEIIWGDATPSGHLTDTYPYDHKYNITYFRGNCKFTHQYTGAPSNCTTMGSGGSAFYNTSVYVEYTEGIYVGYRWFETAFAEHFWDSYHTEFGDGYDGVVQYPFGYGMSYTTFDWNLVSTSIPAGNSITNQDKITFTVEVTNTGDFAGKDVIEIYLTAPYTDGGIEKSYVKLVGYAKSPELKPGQKVNVDVEVEAKDFKSYDCYDDNHNGFKGYELEQGEYQLKLMTDAHNLKEMENNVISYYVANDIQIQNDEATGNKVENLFTRDDTKEPYMSIAIDGSDVGQNIEYVHRNNFPALLTDVEANKPWTNELLRRVNGITVNNSCWNRALGDYWDNATEDYKGNPVNTNMPKWGQTTTSHKLMEAGKLTNIGMRLAADYNDPQWEEVLDQVPFNQAKTIVTENSSYKSWGIAAIGLRTDDGGAFQHAEGASQVGNGVMAPGTSCVGYPGSTVLTQTWNQVLAYMFGKSEGNDMGPAGKDALYSPACNIHRSPYGGRNSGYQSEDPYLSGRTVGNIIRGLGVYGRTSFVKHFACNDQDFNRMGLYTWLTEQALREIYIRSFEEAIKYGDSTGVMTSFNRVGAIWAGGNEALVQGILRDEWGFKGQIITDMTENPTNMDIGFSLRAGGNINLILRDNSTAAAPISTSSTARVQNRVREAIHQVAYSYSHALYKNMTYNETVEPTEAVIVTESKQAWLWWKPAVVSIDALVYGGIAIGAIVVVSKLILEPKRKED